MPGADSLPWLGNLNMLAPATELSVSPYGEDGQSSQSPFPVAPLDKRSYAQNCVVWTKNAGLQVIDECRCCGPELSYFTFGGFLRM